MGDRWRPGRDDSRFSRRVHAAGSRLSHSTAGLDRLEEDTEMNLRLLTVLMSLSTLIGAGVVFDINSAPAAPLQPGGGGSIETVVIDDEGDPVPGAVVAVSDASGGDSVRSTTGDTGTVKSNFPRNGVYTLVATIPDGYTPSEDSDSTLPGRCGGNDLRLCVTVTVTNGVINGPNNDEQGLLSEYGTRAWFKVIDDSPEPRIHAYFTDTSTGKPLPGGTLSIVRARPVLNFTKTVGGDFLKTVSAATYTTSWTPPSGYKLTGAPSVTRLVARLETVLFEAEPIAVEEPAVLVQKDPESAPLTHVVVDVRDADDNSLVPGGLVKFDAWHESSDGSGWGEVVESRAAVTEWAKPGTKLVVSLDEVPPSYVLLGEATVSVKAGEHKNITFLVRRRPVTGDGQSYVDPQEDETPDDPGALVVPPTTETAVAVGNPTPAVPPTTVPPTTVPPTTVPPTTVPPTTVPPTTVPSATVPGSGDPGTNPDCSVPENQVLCMELGLIPPPAAG